MRFRDRDAARKAAARVSRVLRSPFFLAVSGGLLTAIVAPYVIERSRLNMARNDKTITTQYEILERLTDLSFSYLVAARFVMQDMARGQPDSELLRAHLRDYDRVAALTHTGYAGQAYRARMYFGSPELYKALMTLAEKTASVDSEIVRQLAAQKNTPTPADTEAAERWNWISDTLYNLQLTAEKTLELLYQRIGTVPSSEAGASDIGAGEERPTR